MALNNFVVFILTHGRPHKNTTYNTLIRQGYTGKIFIIVDNEDKTIEEYKRLFGEKIIIFDKLAISKTFDTGDNSQDRRSIVYARNACFNIAKELGIEYFIELDDDYPTIAYKFDSKYRYKEQAVLNLDNIFEILLNYYKKIDCLTLALAQNGDFIGGKDNKFAKNIIPKRKAMNSFICSTKRPFKFLGRINEDVNTYTTLGSRGNLLLTIPNVAIHQSQTQKTKGGMTDLYKDNGTYIKSFYTVMYQPSCVKVSLMGATHKRLHHSVSWNNAVPKIINAMKLQ